MSKFDDGIFRDGIDTYAVNSEKYSREEAIEKAAVECELPYVKDYYLAMTDAFVFWRTGRNDDGEVCIGWWLEYSDKRRKRKPCPVYAFHATRKHEKQWGNVHYEYIPQHGSLANDKN